MSYRKIIGFGDSSYVVSLPKDWVVKNGLKKGDSIVVIEEEGSVRISPTIINQSNNRKNITLEFDGDLRKLKSQLIHYYIDSYHTINIVGKDLLPHMKEIGKIVDRLIALEIVQSGSKKVVLQDFLNIHDFSVYDTIRRMDRIVLSMTDDVKNYLLGKHLDVTNDLQSKELDITRLNNLIFKILKRSFNTGDKNILKLDYNDIFYYWEMNLFIEKIGDQLKLIPKSINPPIDENYFKLFEKAMDTYAGAMTANFAGDINAAVNVLTIKKELFEKIEDSLLNLPMGIGYRRASERIKNIVDVAGNLAKVFLRLKLRYTNVN